jgi:transcriptional regulator with XRE-family HTH domain
MPKARPLRKTLFSPPYDRFLELLRAARKDAGLTQAEAAKLLGKPQSFITKCERGERRVDVVELVAFCRIYQVRVAEFIHKMGSLPRRAKPKMG